MTVEFYLKNCRTVTLNDISSTLSDDVIDEYIDIYKEIPIDISRIATLEKTNCILHNGSVNVLLFDLYLLKELANLNSILFYPNSKKEKFGVIYSLKTLAENLLFRREYRIAEKFLKLHNQFFRDIITASHKDLIVDEVVSMTYLQGRFITAHEYGHLIFDKQDSKKVELTKANLKNFIKTTFRESDLTEAFEIKARKAHIKIFNQSHYNKDFSILPDSKFKVPVEKLKIIKNNLTEDDSLLEEMICDEIALDLLFRKYPPNEYISNSTASIVFLYHLRYFSIGSRYSYGFIDESDVDDLFFSIDIRTRALTDFAYGKIENKLGRNEANNWLKNIETIKNKHLDLITFQMMFPAWTALKKEFKYSKEHPKSTSLKDELSLRHSIIKMLS